MTAEHPLDALLDELLPTAAEVAIAVRDRDAYGVEIALKPLLEPADTMRLKALIIDLAAMVPVDDATTDDLLAWTHGPHVADEVYEQIAAFDPRHGRKRCARCRDELPLEEFHKSTRSPDGHRSQCKRCVNEASREATAAKAAQREQDAPLSGEVDLAGLRDHFALKRSA